MLISNELINELSNETLSELNNYLKGDDLTIRFFVSNMVNSVGDTKTISKLFDVSEEFLTNLKNEVNNLIERENKLDMDI